MKRLTILFFIFTVLVAPSFLVSITNFAELAKKKRSKTKTKGIDIQSVFKYIEKYEAFSKTNFGAFINGLFMGVVTDIVEDKAQVQCTQDQFWGLINCFVGGADVGLASYYSSLEVKDLDKITDSFQQTVTAVNTVGTTLERDKSVTDVLNEGQNAAPKTDNSWTSYLSSSFNYLMDKFKSTWNYFVTSIKGFWDNLQAFFESPLLKAVYKITSCANPANFTSLITGALRTTLNFLGLNWISKFFGAIYKAPMIFRKIYGFFQRLYEKVTKKYETTQQTYYNYGLGLGDFFATIAQIYTEIRRMKRFRYLFKSKK